MSIPSILKLLLFSLSLSLLFSLHLAAVDDSPSPSPALSPSSDWDDEDSPSPSPVADGPTADGPTADGPTADGPTADGPAADGPATSDSPSPSPGAATSDSPSPSPGADDDEDLDDLDMSPAGAPGPSAAGPSLTPKEICAATDHPALCLSVVLPQLSGDEDILGVLEIAIRNSSGLAKAGLDMAKAKVNGTSIPPEQASVLMECRDSYDYAVYNFDNVIDVLPERDVSSVKSMLNAIVEDVGDCEKRLVKFGGENPFAGLGDRLVNMTNNCLSIAAQMI